MLQVSKTTQAMSAITRPYIHGFSEHHSAEIESGVGNTGPKRCVHKFTGLFPGVPEG